MSKLGIQINGEGLDLNPGIIIDMERNNPLSQFDNQVIGSFSYPFDVKNTARNARLLNYSGAIQKRIDNSGIDAQVFDNGLQVLNGKIKIERTTPHLNKGSRTGISCYLLSENADFWQQVKTTKLRDVVMGGDRSFEWDGLNDTGDGFWAHIHTVARAATNAFDYAFFPVINHGWPLGDAEVPLMNKMYYDSSEVFFPSNYTEVDLREMNRIVPMPYLHYVMGKVFEHAGWTVNGEILDDTYFRLITIINFRAIDWAYPTSADAASFTPRDPVVFNLQDHMPDMTVGEFLVALKNRFGWWYDFDKSSKTCTIKYLKDVATGELKDITQYTEPVVLKSVLQDRRIYALTNGIQGPDWNLVDFQGYVSQYDDLPAAAEALYGQVYLLTSENNYYICQQADDDSWTWELFYANNYDFTPEGFTDEIPTSSQVPQMDYHAFMDTMLPRVDNMGEWFGRTDGTATWGLHLAFYHGVRFNASNTEAFPYASPHIYDPQGIKIANWGLTYQCFETDGDDVGLYQTFWKPFLDLLNVTEEIEITVHLPLSDYLNLRYENQLVVDGVKMFIKTLKTKIPYDKIINLVCTRM